jgi:O-antigen ligase
MLAMTLALNSPGAKRYLWLAVAAFAVATLLLCGRRKMVFMLPLFIFVIIGLSWMSGRSRSVGTVVAGGLLVVAVVAVGMVVAGGGDAEALRYYLEGSADTLDSLEAHGFGTVVGTLRQTGFFGGGLGFATPGAHQIPFASPRVWQESAPSRVMFELGVPGMAALVFLLARMSRDAWRIVLGAARVGGAGGRYAVGMFAFFICNVGSLTVSGQILGDPFIAAFIGISLGITLGFARFLPERYGRAAARAHGRLRPVSATEKTSAR